MTTMEMTSSTKVMNTKANVVARFCQFISNKAYYMACAAAPASTSASAMVRVMNEER